MTHFVHLAQAARPLYTSRRAPAPSAFCLHAPEFSIALELFEAPIRTLTALAIAPLLVLGYYHQTYVLDTLAPQDWFTA
jgi:hypothetical protein